MASSFWSKMSSILSELVSCFFCGDRGLAIVVLLLLLDARVNAISGCLFGESPVTENFTDPGIVKVAELDFLCPRSCWTLTSWSCCCVGLAVSGSASATVNTLKYDLERLWTRSDILSSAPPGIPNTRRMQRQQLDESDWTAPVVETGNTNIV